MVLDHRHGQRAVQLAPVGQQLVERARIDDRAGQDVGADLGALFEDADAELAPGFLGELLEADAGGEAGRAGADDHHVIGHRLAFGHPGAPVARRPQLTSSQAANVWQIDRDFEVDQPARGLTPCRRGAGRRCIFAGGRRERADLVDRGGRRHARRRGAARLAAAQSRRKRRAARRRPPRRSARTRPCPASSTCSRPGSPRRDRLAFAAPVGAAHLPGRRSGLGADDPRRHADRRGLRRRHPDQRRGRAAVRPDARRDRPRPRFHLSRRALLHPLARRAAQQRADEAAARPSPATISASPRPRRCCCSATPAPRPCSACRCRRRAAAGTRSPPMPGPSRLWQPLLPDNCWTQPRLKAHGLGRPPDADRRGEGMTKLRPLLLAAALALPADPGLRRRRRPAARVGLGRAQPGAAAAAIAKSSRRSAASDWPGASARLAALPEGPLHDVARAELFTRQGIAEGRAPELLSPAPARARNAARRSSSPASPRPAARPSFRTCRRPQKLVWVGQPAAPRRAPRRPRAIRPRPSSSRWSSR